MNFQGLPHEGGTINCWLGRETWIYIKVKVVAGEKMWCGCFLLSLSSPLLSHIRCSSTLFIKKPTNGTVSSLSLERFRNVLACSCGVEDNISYENKAAITQNIMFKISHFGVNGFLNYVRLLPLSFSVRQGSRIPHRDHCFSNVNHLIGIEVCDYLGMQTGVAILAEVQKTLWASFSGGGVVALAARLKSGRQVKVELLFL